MRFKADNTDRRSLPDRRKRPTPVLSRYSLAGGLRKTIRRESDKKKIFFVDRYSTRLLITLLFLFILSSTDAYLTLSLIEKNRVIEANPVMAFYLDYGEMFFLSAKFFITALSILILCICMSMPIVQVALPSALIIYLLIILYELKMTYENLPPF